ncbi:MAG: hypothetical protein MMC23_002797 [Stictis urceolatum]|nr:hypothetical protein [Stictis urceolata]
MFFLLTGGADASIALWDLTETPDSLPSQHSQTPSPSHALTHHPSVVLSSKSPRGHTYGITHLTWFPFDAGVFLSSSYDCSLRLYSVPDFCSTSQPGGIFTFPSVVHSHAMSPLSHAYLVAVATAQPHVRLVDLKSAANTHSLAGHDGAVLSVAWSPSQEHILASAGADGCVRIWDVRRSAPCLGLLDLDDSEGIAPAIEAGEAPRLGDLTQRNRRAHVGAANGLAWTPSGEFLVSSGHDERIRVWDAATGANTLVHFGPRVRNNALSRVLPVVVPEDITGAGREVLLFPSGDEILVAEMREGETLRRLRVPAKRRTDRGGGGGKGGRGTVKEAAWRKGHVEAYSAHADGTVRAWWPWTGEDRDEEEDEEREEELVGEEGERNRKRKALDQVYRELTKKKITFT